MSRLIDNYGTKLRDLCVLSAPTAVSEDKTQEVQLAFTAGANTCVGLQKLFQRFAMFLLTVRGSCLADPEKGTSFGQLLLSAAVTEAAIVAAFGEAVLDYLDWQQDNLLGSSSEDELLSMATLEELDWDKSRMLLRIRIVSRAGEYADFTVPARFA